MLAQVMRTLTRSIEGALAEYTRKVEALRERYRQRLSEEGPEARGIRLLREWLSEDQRAQFDHERSFDVTGSDSGKRYRIHYGTATNVHELDQLGRPRIGWCFLPRGRLVPGDIMLAQKIALETNELAALSIANRFPIEFSPRRGEFGDVGPIFLRRR